MINFVRAIFTAEERAADQEAVPCHRVPAMLDAAPIGFVLADLAGHVTGQ
jgi:hypothetical protein